MFKLSLITVCLIFSVTSCDNDDLKTIERHGTFANPVNLEVGVQYKDFIHADDFYNYYSFKVRKSALHSVRLTNTQTDLWYDVWFDSNFSSEIFDCDNYGVKHDETCKSPIVLLKDSTYYLTIGTDADDSSFEIEIVAD